VLADGSVWPMAVDENKANANSAAMRFLYMVFLDMTPMG
jgi:hypothetical protein